MFLEKMFGSVYGKIWLIILLVAILALIVFLLFKKGKEEEPTIEESEEKNKEESVVEGTTKPQSIVKEQDEIVDYGDFIIVESEDGFFRVRKKDNERTIRRFSTRVEAENYIEKRNLSND